MGAPTVAMISEGADVMLAANGARRVDARSNGI